MANPKRQPFYPAGEFVARKEFTFDGKTYNTGDIFPWEKLGVSERRATTMYNARMLTRKDETKKTVTSKATVKEDTVVKEKVATKKKAKEEVAIDPKEAKRLRAAARKAARKK